LEIKFKLLAFIKKYTLGCKWLCLQFNLKLTPTLLPSTNYITTSINVKKLAFFALFLFFGIIEMKGQTAASSTWALTANGSPNTSGSVNGSTLLWGTQISNPIYGNTNGSSSAASVSNNGWSNNILNNNAYYEYAITPTSGNDLTVNSVSFYYSVSGSSMSLSLYYSTDDFLTSTQLGSNVSNFSNTSSTTQFSNSTNIQVADGLTLKVRVYGWAASAVTRTFRNKMIVISGTTSPISLTSTTITSLSPSSGCIGSSLTINGTNLSDATSVTIGGTPVSSITSNSSTQIVAVVGSGSTGFVSVTTSNRTATSSNQFTVIGNPTASNGGPYCEGATIQLTGGPSGYESYSWSGPNSYSSSNITQTITQNFDSLVTGTSWRDNSTLSGWYISSLPPLKIGTGSLGTGGSYNFGNTTNINDRALGSLCSNTTGTINFGIKITNTTGATVSSIAITFTGEQYRDAGNNPSVVQSLTVDYSTDATNLTTASGTWIPIADLTFNTPMFTTSAGALDGNASSNRIVGISSTLSGISIPNNSSIWLRWTDINDTNNDAGVAIDDVSVVLSAGNMSSLITNATTAMSGNYILTTTNASGCTATATTYVVVKPNPLTSNIYHE
jgi:hypothetical protein